MLRNNIKHLHFDLTDSLAKKDNKDMVDEKTVYVARHGATALNKESGESIDKIRGHIDVPLSDVGIKEAQADGDKLKGKGIEHVFASDLSRAKNTAEIIAKKIGVNTVEVFYNLRPWNLGPTIQGHDSDKVQPTIEYYIEHPDDKPPGGDSFNDFKNNFFNTFLNIIAAFKDKNIIIITHYRCFKLLESHKGEGEIDIKKFMQFSGDKTGHIRVYKDGKLQ